MKVAVFGASGRTGGHIVQQALDRGHQVRALVREHSTMSDGLDRVEIVRGDVTDRQAVEDTIHDSDAVLSVLGPTQNRPGRAISRGMATIISAMRAKGIRRLIVSAGAAVPFEKDQPKLFNKVMGLLVRTLSRHVYEDMLATSRVVTESDRDWTLVRVPMLIDGEASGSLRVGYVGIGTGPRVTRADLASFMLDQLEDETYLFDSPVISH